MNMQDIVDRLNAECALLSDRAYLMRDITEIDDPDSDVPAVFVLRSSDEVSGQSGMGQLVHQERTRQFAVFLLTAGADSSGDPMEALRDQVLTALLTWDLADTQIEYAGGEARPPVSGMDRWQDRFRYTDHLRHQR